MKNAIVMSVYNITIMMVVVPILYMVSHTEPSALALWLSIFLILFGVWYLPKQGDEMCRKWATYSFVSAILIAPVFLADVQAVAGTTLLPYGIKVTLYCIGAVTMIWTISLIIMAIVAIATHFLGKVLNPQETAA